MVFKSVNDLLERTYCIIERIHFAGPSAARTGYTVAASLEKTRTYLLYRPFAEGTPRLRGGFLQESVCRRGGARAKMANVVRAERLQARVELVDFADFDIHMRTTSG